MAPDVIVDAKSNANFQSVFLSTPRAGRNGCREFFGDHLALHFLHFRQGFDDHIHALGNALSFGVNLFLRFTVQSGAIENRRVFF